MTYRLKSGYTCDRALAKFSPESAGFAGDLTSGAARWRWVLAGR